MKIFLLKAISIVIPISFVIIYIALTFSIAPSNIFNIKIINEHKFNKTLYINYNFSQEEKQNIIEATKSWNIRTKGIINFNVKYLTEKNLDKEKSIIFVRELSKDFDENILKQLHIERNNILGYYEQYALIPEIIIVYDNIFADKYTKKEQVNIYRMTIMHELGHAVGLTHNNVKNTLMYSSYDEASKEITNYDFRNICIIYTCDLKKLIN